MHIPNYFYVRFATKIKAFFLRTKLLCFLCYSVSQKKKVVMKLVYLQSKWTKKRPVKIVLKKSFSLK